uniref:Uncharacterized protein n=1 Tax=Anas platyrhynchos platyrhynchos TaxID=8840 RepID=A0A493TBS7_ANAPP
GLGTGIPTPVTPEMERVKRNQENISSVLYKEGLGIGTPVPVTPEMERVKRNQENFKICSSVLYKEEVGMGTPTPVTPEIERVKRNQEIFLLTFCFFVYVIIYIILNIFNHFCSLFQFPFAVFYCCCFLVWFLNPITFHF